MSHWGSERRRGEREKTKNVVCVWKECRAARETKEAAAALNVLVVWPSSSSEATSKPHWHPHRPPFLLLLLLPLSRWPLRHRRRKTYRRGEAKCDTVIAGSWGLRGKRSSTGSAVPPLSVLTACRLLLPLLLLLLLRCWWWWQWRWCWWRCGAGDIAQNKGVLKQEMSEPRLALPEHLELGQMPLWDRRYYLGCSHFSTKLPAFKKGGKRNKKKKEEEHNPLRLTSRRPLCFLKTDHRWVSYASLKQ